MKKPNLVQSLNLRIYLDYSACCVLASTNFTKPCGDNWFRRTIAYRTEIIAVLAGKTVISAHLLTLSLFVVFPNRAHERVFTPLGSTQTSDSLCIFKLIWIDAGDQPPTR